MSSSALAAGVRYLRGVMALHGRDQESDEQLLHAFAGRRDDSAFAALVGRHGPMVMNVCRRVLGQQQDAEDAFQATFVVLARKAALLRDKTALAAFLHGTAHRMAMKAKQSAARRRQHEGQAPSRTPVDPIDELSWREVRTLLDEEIARLPEKSRSVFVLCDLEGISREEAAKRLGLKAGTVSSRLTMARKRLAQRLALRGVELTMVLAATALMTPPASAVSMGLMASTIKAALATAAGEGLSDLVSASVAELVQSATAAMVVSKAKIAAIFLLIVATSGSLVSWYGRASGPLAVTPQPPAANAYDRAKAAPIKPEAAKTGEIQGRVFGPDGKPVAGAKVYVSPSDKDKSDSKVRALTDADGGFRFLANRAEVERNEMLAVGFPGFGPDWVSLKDAIGSEATLRLVRDDMPIQGRVLNLEGHPIAGATVRVKDVAKMPGEDLTPWLTELQAKAGDRRGVDEIQRRYQGIMKSIGDIPGSPRSVKTGMDGRFQLWGFGRERVVHLRIEGPRIEHRTVTVMVRSGPVNALPGGVHGAVFNHLAGPSKPIRGTVRDKDSGAPLAGIRIRGTSLPEWVDTVTDKDGQYEISGIRKSKQYHLIAGYSSAHYLIHWKHAGDTTGLDPITVNFEMERGLPVRVRVREKGTGKPVSGLIMYVVRTDNPTLKKSTSTQNFVMGWNSTTREGAYNLAALPGPAYIVIRADEDRFPRARVKGQKEDQPFLEGVAPTGLPLNQCHAVVPIDPSAHDPKSLVCNVDLDPGRSVSGIVVGLEDRPLTGSVSAAGLGSLLSFPGESELPDGRFRIGGLEPGRPRTVVFWHEKQKLARAIVVRGDENAPLKVRLVQRGTLIGRWVDAMGRPRQGIEVLPQLADAASLPPSLTLLINGSRLHEAVLPSRAFTDAEGRFQIKGLVCGLNYALLFREKGMGGKGIEVKEFSLKPGATVDMGEIKMEAIPDKGPKEKPKP